MSFATSALFSAGSDTGTWERHLAAVEAPTRRTDRMVLHHLLLHGHADAAAALRDEADLDVDIDAYLIPERNYVRTAILDGRVGDAVAVMDEVFPDLLEELPDLSFRLRTVQLIHALRTRSFTNAVAVLREFVLPLVAKHRRFTADAEHLVALMCLDPSAPPASSQPPRPEDHATPAAAPHNGMPTPSAPQTPARQTPAAPTAASAAHRGSEGSSQRPPGDGDASADATAGADHPPSPSAAPASPFIPDTPLFAAAVADEASAAMLSAAGVDASSSLTSVFATVLHLQRLMPPSSLHDIS